MKARIRRPARPISVDAAHSDSANLQRVIVVLAVVLLVATAVLARLTYTQTVGVSERASMTAGLVNANVRTLGQAQRELLILEDLLDTGASRAELRNRAAFVSQRVQEGSLSFQELTLQSQDLLQIARADEQAWRDDIRPELLALPAPTARDPRLVRALRAKIAQLEQSYNTLVSQGEINRKAQAARAHVDAQHLLRSARFLLVGMLLVAPILLSLLGIGWRVSRRDKKRREADHTALLAMADDLSRYAHAVRQAPTAMVLADAQMRTIGVNPAFEEIAGKQTAELLGLDPRDVLLGAYSDRHQADDLSRSIDAGEAFHREILAGEETGQGRWLDLALSPVLNAEGRLDGWIGAVTDVTERREAAALLERARAQAEGVAEERSRFLAVMSHEIRTPLNAVIGMTELLTTTTLDAEQRDLVETADRAGKHLLSLITDVLDLAALDARRVSVVEEDFRLDHLVEEVLALCSGDAIAQGIDLRITRSRSLPLHVHGDVQHLRQVLINVVGNAVKYTDHGHVIVGLTRDRSGDYLLRIEDTGIGVPAWRIESLFDPFERGEASTRSRIQGTGLGLAISRQLVDLMGGALTLTSVVGEGTVVEIRMPLREAVPMPRAADDLVGDVSGLRVLVAEDDPANQKVIRLMLRRTGIDPVIVADGEAAVRAIRDQGPFDIAFLDLQLPILSGTDSAAIIRTLPGRPILIAYTASSAATDGLAMSAAGFDDVLLKPTAFATLNELLHRWVCADPSRP